MSQIIIAEGAAPSTPATGAVAVYAKADGRLYIKDDTGAEIAAYLFLTSSNPVALGSAAPGTASDAARSDHVHPTTGLGLLGTAQNWTAAQTFRAASSVRAEAAATQDAVVLAGRAGGTNSYAVTLTPATLSASRTVTLPDAATSIPIASFTYTIAGPTAARTFTFPDANASVAILGANTFTAAQALGNNNLTGIKTASFNGEGTLTTTTGAVTVDWTAAQNYKQNEPTGAITYTFTAPPGICHLQLRILSDGTSSAFTHVWPGTVKWLGATWAAVANKNAIINFWWDGTNYWAMGSNEV